MKLIINIPDDDYEFVKEQVDSGYCNDVRQIDNRLYHFVTNGNVLSANATIGDVIKVLFPKVAVTNEDRALIHFYVDDKDGHTDFSGCMQKYVWNAPYKVGDTDGNS